MADGDDATATLIQYRMSLWATTFALDYTAGMPWLSLLGQRPFQPAIVEGAVRALLLATPGVRSVDAYTFTSQGTRKGSAQITVSTDQGNTLTDLTVTT
jgi:hypothetical protein